MAIPKQKISILVVEDDRIFRSMAMDSLASYIHKPMHESELRRILQTYLAQQEITLFESEKAGGNPRGFLKKRSTSS